MQGIRVLTGRSRVGLLYGIPVDPCATGTAVTSIRRSTRAHTAVAGMTEMYSVRTSSTDGSRNHVRRVDKQLMCKPVVVRWLLLPEIEGRLQVVFEGVMVQVAGEVLLA